MGVQLYRVDRERDGRLVMTPIGPRANLFDYLGRKLGTHFMGEHGPVWKLGADCVVGKELRKRTSPNADSIPELQLAATASGAGGVLGRATLIEQIGTIGGVAPAIVACLHAGDTLESPYAAEYVFYAAAS
jgi:hypothetical protein